MKERELPCYPCPHKGKCCRWGTHLTDEEGEALLDEFGAEFVFYSKDDDQYRTQTKDGRCAFYDKGCTIHEHENYPRVCRIFPWRDGRDDDALMAKDADLCPELDNEDSPYD